ncbi:MAG: hypothetical protein IJL52_07555 [Clostridia bacterium]|nr:hypothetical protein [Clostridia bacterium]
MKAVPNKQQKGLIIMRKNIVRVITLVLVFVTLFSLSIPAFAAKVSSVNINASAYGGVSTYFYATVPANKSGSIKLTMGKGKLVTNAAFGESLSYYASYEIKVWRYVSNSWKLEQDFDAYHASSKTISFKKYSAAQKYKIQVYCWKTLTTINSYIDKQYVGRLVIYAAGGVSSPYWSTLPTCVAKNNSNCTLYNSCP